MVGTKRTQNGKRYKPRAWYSPLKSGEKGKNQIAKKKRKKKEHKNMKLKSKKHKKLKTEKNRKSTRKGGKNNQGRK